jgi:ribosomal protein S18 acetylase RimI-like enzyme
MDEICRILCDFDKEFKPSLLAKVKDFNSYGKKVHDKGIVLAVKEHNDFLGFATFYANDTESNIAYLALFAVHSRAENRGISKILLDECFEMARKRGMTVFKLEVMNSNEKAINLYIRNGFEFCCEAAVDSIYMIKKL